MQKGPRTDIAWVEERAAKVGLSVEVLTMDNEYWDVVEVYSTNKMNESELRDYQQKYRQGFHSIK